jgi:hypothetical protein
MSWQLYARNITIGRIEVQVRIEADEISRPMDAECYTQEDIRAWRRDEWRYVGVAVSPLGYPDIEASLWAIEAGRISDRDISYDQIISMYAPDLMADLRQAVARVHGELGQILGRWTA